MNRYEAVKLPNGQGAIVDTQTPGDSAHGRVVATCSDIGEAVYLVGVLNS